MEERDGIPADAWEEARKVAEDEQFRLVAVFGTAFVDEGTVEAIARAILAERERCARIALAHISEPGLSENPAYVRFNPADFMAKKIAAAIRNP